MVEREYMQSGFEGGSPFRGFWRRHAGMKGVVIGLIAIHLFMHILKAISPGAAENLYLALALNPSDVLRKFHVWQLVTGTLLHDMSGLGHIFWNCFSIFIFGRIVEDRIGTRRFLFFCLGAAVAASLGYLVFAVFRSDIVAMVGASGASMGLLMLVTLWHPRMKILLFFVFPVELWVLAAILVVIDLIGVLDRTGGDIANAAHLAGALYGWVYLRYGGGFGRVFEAIDRAADRRVQERERKRQLKEAELRREVDRILDKVNREGMAALTDQERRFLKEASEKLRG